MPGVEGRPSRSDRCQHSNGVNQVKMSVPSSPVDNHSMLVCRGGSPKPLISDARPVTSLTGVCYTCRSTSEVSAQSLHELARGCSMSSSLSPWISMMLNSRVGDECSLQRTPG